MKKITYMNTKYLIKFETYVNKFSEYYYEKFKKSFRFLGRTWNKTGFYDKEGMEYYGDDITKIDPNCIWFGDVQTRAIYKPHIVLYFTNGDTSTRYYETVERMDNAVAYYKGLIDRPTTLKMDNLN